MYTLSWVAPLGLTGGNTMEKNKNKDLNKILVNLDLSDPDKVVTFLLSFYDENSIHNSKQLVDLLKKYKPLITAEKLQKGY